MSKRILVIGTGNIGKRFLQAIHIAGISNNVPCYCYDNSISALDNIKEFLHSYKLEDNTIKVHSYQEFLDLITHNSLVIVATTAKGRINLLIDILDRNPCHLIIEKPVTQTEAEYEALLRKHDTADTEVYVHYYLRFQPYVKRIKALLDETRPLNYSITLPGNGIACNGIHYIDLFLWLTHSKKWTITNLTKSILYEQKRQGFRDVYGGFTVETGIGDIGKFYNSKTAKSHLLNVSNGKTTANVYEDQSVMSIVENAGDHSFSKIETRLASEYLVDVMAAYITDNWQDISELTGIREAFRSHQILFRFLRLSGHLNVNIT